MSTALAVMSALFTAYDGLSADLSVFRGKYVTSPDGDFLTVGWTPNTPAALTGNMPFSTEDNVFRAEDFSVINYLETMTGDTDDASILAREQRLFAYWEQIQALHLANRKLDGAVGANGYAQLGRFDFTPDEAGIGFVAGLVFNVDIHALI